MKVKSRIPAVSLVKFRSAPSRRSVLLTQAAARKVHFLKRFRERVGYALSNDKYNELLALVSVSGRFMYKRENEVGAVYNVRFNGLTLKVVYDVLTQSLITVLSPPDK